MNKSRHILKPAAWIFYAAIVFEFLFMITPFALYFYAAYKPALGLLNASPYTAWLTGFFLPHFSQTSSGFLQGVSSFGWYIAYLGLFLFLVSAIQLYGSKLLRRDAVTGILYRYIRHPQYLALAILGLGTTLIWPRFIVLIAFVSMLFIYRWLAHFEEEDCAQKYGAPYREYLQKTGMFLPRLHNWKRELPSASRPAWAVLLLFAGTLGTALLAGVALRELTLGSISAIYEEREAIVSPALTPLDKLQSIYSIAMLDDAAIQFAADGGNPLLTYVVPEDWYLPDLPIDDHETVRNRGGHGTPAHADFATYHVLITRIRTHATKPAYRDILRKAFAFDPYLVLVVDLDTGRVTGKFAPPGTVIWGDISPPLF